MNLSFIKLDINIMNDSKIKMIRSMPDGDKILVLWIGILCLGMKSGRPGIVEIGDGIPFTAESLSVELNISLTTVKLGLKIFVQFKMVEIWEDSELFIVNFEKHQNLERIRTAAEVSKISSRKYREKMKMLPDSDGHVTVTTKEVTRQTKTKRRQREDKENNTPSKNDGPEGSGKKVYNERILKFVDGFSDYMITERGNKAPKKTGTLIENSSGVVDKLIRLDGFEFDYVRDVSRWAVKDDFFSKNFFSLASLRKKSPNGATKFANMATKYDDDPTAKRTNNSTPEDILKKYGMEV